MHVMTRCILVRIYDLVRPVSLRRFGKSAQTHHPVLRLFVLALRLPNNILRQRDILLASDARRDEPVSQVLLVERRLRLALDIGVS